MSNELDETRDPVNEQGRDIHVIEKSLPITIDWRSKVFTFFLWFPLVIPGIVFAIMKIKATFSSCRIRLASARSARMT